MHCWCRALRVSKPWVHVVMAASSALVAFLVDESYVKAGYCLGVSLIH